MKILSIFWCAALLLGGVVGLIAADSPAPAGKGTLRHVVCFKFKDSASPADIKKVEDAFRALKTKVPGIVAYEWGTNISPENMNQGFTHCFLLTFNRAQDRDAYLVHPEHKAFGKMLGPYLDKAFVIDFQVQK